MLLIATSSVFLPVSFLLLLCPTALIADSSRSVRRMGLQCGG